MANIFPFLPYNLPYNLIILTEFSSNPCICQEKAVLLRRILDNRPKTWHFFDVSGRKKGNITRDHSFGGT